MYLLQLHLDCPRHRPPPLHHHHHHLDYRYYYRHHPVPHLLPLHLRRTQRQYRLLAAPVVNSLR